ncbi:glycosyltransferase family protein [Saccharicrinis aurantiacus]|uniref:glycosyltransferase n=1 Tax=Saccharicrinis aurantiacus TaxID=1849719 RepID=UPI00083901F2|nr:glycosyltransferase [Saccharicrinis aurantiacus]
MKILLVGEFSGLHAILAEGLRQEGHQVTVISEGCGWKNYPRDIDLNFGRFRLLKSVLKIAFNIHRLIGFDVVQLINPCALHALPKKNMLFYKFIKRFNKSVFLGANGDDYFIVSYGLTGKYSKSIFSHKDLLADDFITEFTLRCLDDDFKQLNLKIANECDGITACCAEYEIAYKEKYSDKLTFIPLPIDTSEFNFCNSISEETEKIIFFLGHYKYRRVLKGTDIIEKVLLRLKDSYPDEVELRIVDSIPFDEYKNLMDSSHVLVDQLYSYGCGINGVLGMSKGLIVAGGADSYMYQLIGEEDNQPLVNLPVDEEEMFIVLEELIKNKRDLFTLAKETREFSIKHHNYIKVAKQYVDFWESKISQ